MIRIVNSESALVAELVPYSLWRRRIRGQLLVPFPIRVHSRRFAGARLGGFPFTSFSVFGGPPLCIPPDKSGQNTPSPHPDFADFQVLASGHFIKCPGERSQRDPEGRVTRVRDAAQSGIATGSFFPACGLGAGAFRRVSTSRHISVAAFGRPSFLAAAAISARRAEPRSLSRRKGKSSRRLAFMAAPFCNRKSLLAASWPGIGFKMNNGLPIAS